MASPTTCAEVVCRRTYRRPVFDQSGSVCRYESREEMIRRSHRDHQKALWDLPGSLDEARYRMEEISTLESIAREGYGSVAGRTRWLGGTDIASKVPESQFNCAQRSVTRAEDIGELFWLELVGCGTGFVIEPGVLTGFYRLDNLNVIDSNNNASYRGVEDTFAEVGEDTYQISVGDSAKGWVDALVALVDPPAEARQRRNLLLDFSEIRGAGERLKGFGWICNGSAPFRAAMVSIYDILRAKGGSFLDGIDILDILNHLGTVLSTRRSAQIAQMASHHPEWRRFLTAKRNRHVNGNMHRSQSNNTTHFYDKPSMATLEEIVGSCFTGDDMGIFNMKSAQHKCPWAQGTNPCSEIILPDPGFCNLVEVNGTAFGANTDFRGLERTVRYLARANYRQTCVDLTKSGMLSEAWNTNNNHLRLCGVSITGIVDLDHWMTDYQIKRLRDSANYAARSMAEEMGLPYPKAVTCVKPSGTISKVFGDHRWGEVPQGIHLPLGKHIINWISFSLHDPLLKPLDFAGYRIQPNKHDPSAVVVGFPVKYRDNPLFEKTPEGAFVNREPATSQLRRIFRWNRLWCDHNVSCTVNISKEEVTDVARMIHDNWDNDSFVALSFLPRTDPTTKPEDFGALYLPQEVVTEDDYLAYATTLQEPRFDDVSEDRVYEVTEGLECEGGACPVR